MQHINIEQMTLIQKAELMEKLSYSILHDVELPEAIMDKYEDDFMTMTDYIVPAIKCSVRALEDA